jgi:glycosyltransferase involved in cell wall biosynthesis
VRNTSQDRIEHVVCVINDAEFFGSAVRSAGVKVIELRISAKRPFLSATRAFRKVISSERPDILHSWLYDANIVSRLSVIPFGRIPLITSWQSADYEPAGIVSAGWNPRKVGVLKMIDIATARLTNPYFVACSDFVKRSYERNFGFTGRGVRTIYNAVDPRTLDTVADPRLALRKEFGLPDDSFVFLNVGRLDPQKNQKLILKAFAAALEKLPNSYLLIAGVGSLSEELNADVVRLGLSDRVLFLGRRSDIGSLLEFADVFVFPSLLEGLGLALVEAMFKKLPCIASKLPVFEEFIEDRRNGILIDPSSPADLADAMISLYKNKAWRRSLAIRGFETVSRKFNAAITAKQWEEMYQNVASESHG